MIGIVALALAAFVAAFAISTDEAWWTMALVVFAVIVLGVERSSLRRKDAVGTAVGLIGSIILGAAGLWMIVLGAVGNARPCDECFDNGILFLPGLGVVGAGIVLAAIAVRSLARAFGPKAAFASDRDPQER